MHLAPAQQSRCSQGVGFAVKVARIGLKEAGQGESWAGVVEPVEGVQACRTGSELLDEGGGDLGGEITGTSVRVEGLERVLEDAVGKSGVEPGEAEGGGVGAELEVGTGSGVARTPLAGAALRLPPAGAGGNGAPACGQGAFKLPRITFGTI